MKARVVAVLGAAIFFLVTINSAHAGPQQQADKKLARKAMTELSAYRLS